MIYTDHHIHSNCSTDAEDTMLDMALACGEHGVTRMCFTDHCDMDWEETGLPYPEYDDIWRRSVDAWRHTVAEAPSKLDICLGIELGEMNHDPERAQRLLESVPELDFVLASIHNVRMTPDFYCLRYKSEQHCIELLDTYMDELIEIANMDNFDVLSHIGYTRRYMLRAGYQVSVSDARYADKLEHLLKTLIERGKGIEANTSGLRHPAINDTIPTTEILRLYRALGGEIITVGSDAHRTVDAGRGIFHTFDLLRELGFRYVCAFRARKPEFIKL